MNNKMLQFWLFVKNKINTCSSKHYFALALIICFIGSAGNVLHGIAIKYFMRHDVGAMTLYEFLSIRCLATILLLLPFNLKNFYILKKALWLNIFVSLFYAFDVILWNEGISKVDVNLAVVIMFLVPVWINILSKVILKEDSFNIRHLFALFLCFIGLAFIVNKIESVTMNIIFIFLNSFVVSLGLVFQKKWKSIRPIKFSLFFNSLILLCALVIIGSLKSGHFVFFGGKFSFVDSGFFKAILAVVFFDIMEFAGLYKAYGMIDISYLQPIRFTRIIISAIFSYLFLNESITFYQFIGISIIISGNIIVVYELFKKNKIIAK